MDSPFRLIEQRRLSIVGSLRTGDYMGAVDGVLSGSPLMETKKEKANRGWGVLRAQAPPSLLALGSPRSPHSSRPSPQVYPTLTLSVALEP